MGLFSKWLVYHRATEKQAFRKKKEEYKFLPTEEFLKDTYGGGYFQLRKIGFFGGVKETIHNDLSDEEMLGNAKKQNTITIKTSGGSVLEFNNDILADKQAVENVSTLMQITREPSQSVVDLREKLTVFDDIFGERLESLIGEVLTSVGDMDEDGRESEYQKQVQMKLSHGIGEGGISIKPVEGEVSSDKQNKQTEHSSQNLCMVGEDDELGE